MTSERRPDAESLVAVLSHALDEVAEGVFLFAEGSTGFLYVNRSACESLGYSREVLTGGMGVVDIDPTLDEGRLKAVMELQRTSPRLSFSTLHQTREGRLIPVEISSSAFRFQGRAYYVSVSRDVSERRAAEDQRLQAQQLEAMGRLAGGVAHDFNNLLSAVELQATLLLDDPTSSPSVREGLAEILGTSRRATDLTRQLLTFSRHQPFQPVALDLAATLAGLQPQLEEVMGPGVAVALELAPGLPAVSADPVLVERAVMNLAVNARDAMPGGGQLTLRLRGYPVSDEAATRHPGVPAGPAVCLEVADSGRGIPAAALPRIFEPFFTTKDSGRETGLGLATVAMVAQHHRGWVEAESAVGAGSTFRMILPARQGAAAAPPEAHPPAGARGGNELVLLVEDDEQLRTVARTVLRRHGYRVLEAGSAREGLARWREAGPGVDLLLTDLVLPGGDSGRQLADALLADRPGLRVLFISGYGGEVADALLRVAGEDLLPKPFTATELARRVREALDRPPPAG